MPKDYFSTQADLYQQFRPSYPAALFEFLQRDTGSHSIVWDCATGNGQAALALSDRAGLVIATDQSRAQLAHAAHASNIQYVQALAEATPIKSGSIDLVTVAQALHWFDFGRFYHEVARVLKPGGLFAAWTYSFLTVSPQLGADIDTIVRWFYHDVIGAYWPPERRWVDEEYRTLPFPFTARPTPSFTIEVAWDLNALLGYLASWSATQRYRDATGHDPIPLLAARLTPLWGENEHRRHLSWPLTLRAGTRP